MTTKETWKPVTIGGLTGILMGAGVMYAAQKTTVDASEEEVASADNTLKVAEVDDSMSFKEAFESARAQVGAGGVFSWRGNIFNTYTADEWNSLSGDDKKLFAEQVKPEISASEVDTTQLAESTSEDDVQIAAVHGHDIDESWNEAGKAQLQTTTWNEIIQEKNDVRIVGFKEIEIDHGRSIVMEELDVNGQRVAVIDVDKDGDPDFAMTDLNHNHQMDEGEVIDLHTGEAIAFTNDDPTVETVADLDTFSA